MKMLIATYLINYELDNVYTVCTYQEDLGSVKGLKKMLNWKFT